MIGAAVSTVFDGTGAAAYLQSHQNGLTDQEISMATGPQGQKRPDDPIACAVHVGRIAIGEIEDTKAEPPNRYREETIDRLAAEFAGMECCAKAGPKNVSMWRDSGRRFAEEINIGVGFEKHLRAFFAKSLTDHGAAIRYVVHQLPKGSVATYGNISEMVYGHCGEGRAVGSAIRKGAERDREGFPWWRVVGKDWRPRIEGQERRLKGEGVEFCSDGSVHLRHWYTFPNCHGDKETESVSDIQ